MIFYVAIPEFNVVHEIRKIQLVINSVAATKLFSVCTKSIFLWQIEGKKLVLYTNLQKETYILNNFPNIFNLKMYSYANNSIEAHDSKYLVDYIKMKLCIFI